MSQFLLHQAVQLVSDVKSHIQHHHYLVECCYSPVANADYELENMTSQLLIALNNSDREISFHVLTIDDTILEDYEERFGIAISLENPSILAEIKDDHSYYNITILDNEGSYRGFKKY